MPFCFVPECNHSNLNVQERETKCAFFRFPQNKALIKEWVKSIRRADSEPSENPRVCSCHFYEGKKEAGPTLFSGNGFKDNLPRMPSPEHGKCLGASSQVAEPDMDSAKSVQELQRRVQELEEDVAKRGKELEEVKAKHSKEEENMRTVLTEKQLTMMKTGRRPRQWDEDTIVKALGIRTSTSKRVYEYLREQQRWPLPCVRSLSRWVSGFRVEPSSMDQLLRFLRAASAELPSLAKNCAILFDEMSVDSRLCYEQQRDVVLRPFKQAQVIMVRSICGSWKQPVYLGFDTAVSSEILLTLIRALEDMGYPVRAVVSDMGSKNVGLWRQLGISYDGETGMANPTHPDRRVWFFTDVPHCLKNLRNHIFDDGLFMGGRSEPSLDADLLVELVKVSAPEFTLNRKLSALHVHELQK